jgi:hypothetical protein
MIAAMSNNVRGIEVTGMPSTRVTSSSLMAAQCARSPGRDRNLLGLVTSVAIEDGDNNPQRAAAERWLNTASVPALSTAAIQRVRSLGRM